MTTPLERAARNHARAMTYLHTYIDEVAVTSGTLMGTLCGDAPDTTKYGPTISAIDDAMGKLGDAYRALAAAFDDLPE